MSVYPFLLSCLLSCLTVSMAAAQEKAAPNGKYETVNGATIYYEEYGEGEPLLL